MKGGENNVEDFERFIMQSDHPKALEVMYQFAEYLVKLRKGIQTQAETDALEAKIKAVYEEFGGQVPQGF